MISLALYYYTIVIPKKRSDKIGDRGINGINIICTNCKLRALQAYKPTKRQTYTIFKKSFFYLKYDEIKLQLFIYIKILDF